MQLKKLIFFIFVVSYCFAADQSVNVSSSKAPPPLKPQPLSKEKQAYLKMGLGASFSINGSVSAPSAFWDPAVQGYNDNFGITPVFDVAFGYDIISWITAELSLSYRPHYSYKKYQTPPNLNDSSPGFLGSKTRRFNLDVRSLLFSCYLNGRGFSRLRWEAGPCNSYFYPFIGVGIGVSGLTIYNFRSTNLNMANEGFPGFGTFGSENQYTKRYRFTYQVLAGIAYRLLPSWAFELGYRWFSVNQFTGPSFIRDPSGYSGDVSGVEWKQRLRANEIFGNIKYYF